MKEPEDDINSPRMIVNVTLKSNGPNSQRARGIESAADFEPSSADV